MPEVSHIASREWRDAQKKALREEDRKRIESGVSPVLIGRENSAFKESFADAEISNLSEVIGR